MISWLATPSTNSNSSACDCECRGLISCRIARSATSRIRRTGSSPSCDGYWWRRNDELSG